MKNLWLVFTLFISFIHAQSIPTEKDLAGLKFREIGPALMSGRIADIALHPENENIWYVAVGSGGVWKTTNAGTTWHSIFDGQSSYSIGCITVDPINPNTVWVGTGENVGGRHVGYGDGIYQSLDGGKTWTHKGLKSSEHISRIIIHPEDSNTLWVATQGPLWSKGGERGVYKSDDGGNTWKRTLGDDTWTGATEIVIDPRNPDRLYAATWDRHRTVASYLGGGPGTGLYRSEDGGNSWTHLKNGLPESNLGKIGLAISPQKPDEVYAAIELDNRTGGVYKSFDRGNSWTKQSDAVSGATGPHYYQELYACPHHYDRLYLVDVRMQISDDGGKTFRRMKEKYKHSDNHAIIFRKDDPNYLLVGTDGGIYESFDNAENWRFIDNLPVTQFYKIAVDDAEPFYNVFGGTQDNNTQGGPSRTDNVQGIQNSDWKVVLNWDGHQPATEPGNPDIMYGQRQQGTLSRIDMITGEVIDIQPQPGAGEPHERFNWDAPILVSPHDPATIYFASYRLWKSTNRGDDWTALSGDLTRNEERMSLPIMGKQQSFDNPWDVNAMSNYNTITSIAVSPFDAQHIYIGTDDGIIQTTKDEGNTWQKTMVNTLNLPGRSYVNNIIHSLHDANTAYVALDNHKEGDYKPYILKTSDGGKTWRNISGNLPDRHLVWRLVQDHIDPSLLFAATEYGIFFTKNEGKTWTQLKGNIPTISFRDITIHRRENDLIAGSFGRGIHILDDITPLRTIETVSDKSFTLFPVKEADWYIPRSSIDFDDDKASQGSGYYTAPNPAFGATFSFYLKDDYQSPADARKAKEKDIKGNIPFPGWESIEAEKEYGGSHLVFTIKDSDGNVVRRLFAPAKKGIHRINWDLRRAAPQALALVPPPPALFPEIQKGILVAPGEYIVSASLVVDGEITDLSETQSIKVTPLRSGALTKYSMQEIESFWKEYENLVRESTALSLNMQRADRRLKRLVKSFQHSTGDMSIMEDIHKTKQSIHKLMNEVMGLDAKNGMGEKNLPTIGERMFSLNIGIMNSTYGPTGTHLKTMKIVSSEMIKAKSELQSIVTAINGIQNKLETAGAPILQSDKID